MDEEIIVSYNIHGRKTNISLDLLAKSLNIPYDILKEYYTLYNYVDTAVEKAREIAKKRENILNNIALGGIDLIIDELNVNNATRYNMYSALATELASILSEEEYDGMTARMQTISEISAKTKEKIKRLIAEKAPEIKLDNRTLSALIVNLDANSNKEKYNKSDMDLLDLLFKLNSDASIIQPYAVVNELGKLTVTKQEAIKIYQKSTKNGVLTLTKEQASLLLDVINDGIPTRNINRNLLENVYIGNKTYSSIVEDTYKATI